MTKKQKLSDEIFDKLMSKEDEIFDKIWDLTGVLLSQRKLPGPIHIKAHEIDDLLFDRHELSCAHSVVDNMEKNKK